MKQIAYEDFIKLVCRWWTVLVYMSLCVISYSLLVNHEWKGKNWTITNIAWLTI